ncbi:MAG: hypothetical protein AB7E29_13345 [Xanthobacter sp.]
MSRMAHLLLTGAALSCAPLTLAAGPAFSQAAPSAATAPAPADAASPPADPRFSFSQTDDGTLRMDSKTGAVSLCAKGPEGFACKLLPDSQKVYEAELARLRKEIAALKGEEKHAEDPDELDPNNLSGDLPPDPADVDAALDYAEKLFLRLKQMYDNLGSSPAPNPQEENL